MRGRRRPRVDHRLVAGEVRLRGQDVHRLGAGDARHPLHRQRLQPCCRVGVDRLPLPHRIERADEQRAVLCAVKRRRIGSVDAQDDARVLEDLGATADLRAAASKSASGIDASLPAPVSTATSAPSAANFLTVSGMAAQRVSPSASFRTAIFILLYLRMSSTNKADDEANERAKFQHAGETL